MTVNDIDFANLQAAVDSLNSELGNDPSGVYSSLRNRLDVLNTKLNSYQASRLINLGGDLSGVSNDASVIKLNGISVSSVTPLNNFVLTYNSSTLKWEPKISQTFSASGDLFGTNVNQKVIAIQNKAVSSNDPIDGQVLAWDESLFSWIPTTVSIAGFTAGGDLSGTSSNQIVSGLYGRPLFNIAPTLNQVMQWDGYGWKPGTVSGGGSFTASGDLSGNNVSQTVIKINSATVPAAGALVTGNGLYVTGTSSLSYSGLNLAGGASYVFGVLPAINLPDSNTIAKGIVQLSGDLSGIATSPSVVKIQGRNILDVSPSDGYILTWDNTNSYWKPVSRLVPRTYRMVCGYQANIGTSSNISFSIGNETLTKSSFYDYSFKVIARKTSTNNCNVILYNLTDATVVSTISITNSSMTEYTSSITLSGSISKMYEVQIVCTGTPTITDGIICTNASIIETPN